MLTILSVLRSGGVFTPLWVEKLKRGVERNLTLRHRFVCLSDTDVSCERIPMSHDWPRWWGKVELFRKGVISSDTLYIDLDTCIVGNMDAIASTPHDFAMLRNFSDPAMVSSCVMWFRKVPHQVYERFASDPEFFMSQYAMTNGVNGANVGDQAFIRNTLGDIPMIDSPAIRSYKKHCADGPGTASVVCFGGRPRLDQVRKSWISEAWR